MRVVVVLVCLTLGAGLLVACSSPTIAIPSLTSPTPSGVESSIAARIIAEHDTVLEATVREKEGKDIYVAVVIADNTGEAAAEILMDRIIEQLGEPGSGSLGGLLLADNRYPFSHQPHSLRCRVLDCSQDHRGA